MYKMSVVVAIAVLLVSCGDEVVDGDARTGKCLFDDWNNPLLMGPGGKLRDDPAVFPVK